jgi:inositol polyphosphate 1-phosphatase
VKHQGCAYILSPPTTFKWDTCAPQAILSALGGGIINYQDGLKLVKESANLSDEDLANELSKLQIRYDRPDATAAGTGQPWCNTGGLLAYTQSKDIVAILRLLL